MTRIIVLILLIFVQPMFAWAESGKPATNETIIHKNKSGKVTDVLMTSLDAVKLAGKLIEQGDYEHATQILTKMPQTDNLPVEIERWYLIAQIAQKQGDIDTAIKIYRKLLDEQPDLAKVRYELAQCYMLQHKWYRADYHLRLAMTGNDIPDFVKQAMMYDRYIVRQNKNWNVWFNFGVAPDNNINQVAGGEECVLYMGTMYCRQLPHPISAVGYDFVLGGSYEFKLDQNWRWKSDANIYSTIYNLHDYDDLYFGASTGPRYVWANGDVWAAGTFSRRLYGWDGYNVSYGGKIDANYDISRKLSMGLLASVTDNIYDTKNMEYLDGQTYSLNPRVIYSFDASKYAILRVGISRENGMEPMSQDWRYNFGLGIGAELPWGFHIYAEPSIGWVNYDGPRWAIKNNVMTRITEHDMMQRYIVSLSNNKVDIWGFMPTLTFSYTRRDSNIPNRGYDKTALEFSMQQRF